MKETKYGMISDIHQDPRVARLAIDILKSQGAEKLLVNGDIGNRQRALKETQNYTAEILDAVGRSDLEAFVQPGSHETLGGYRPVLDYFSDKYENIFDVQNVTHVKSNGHELAFLPGSDFVSGGEYRIGSGELPSGDYYVDVHNKFIDPSNERELQRLNELGKLSGVTHFQNMNDLKSIINDPYKTIAVCHVPRKFDNLENGVDMAEFGMPNGEFLSIQIRYEDGSQETVYVPDLSQGLQKQLSLSEPVTMIGSHVCDKDSIFPKSVAESILSKNPNLPIELKKENRGNEDLKRLYEEIGITKAVTGHFHESGHRANDSYGNHVNEGDFVNDLFWNSGHLDVGQTGILTIRGNQISYRNIRLQDFLNQRF